MMDSINKLWGHIRRKLKVENGSEVNNKSFRKKNSSRNVSTQNEVQLEMTTENENPPKTEIEGSKPQAIDQNQSSAIFKLNVDCFEELFDWLSLEDLHAISQTCKRLQKVAIYYFHQNCSSLDVYCEENGISVFNHMLRIDSFSDDIKRYNSIGAKCESLKEIHFRCAVLSIQKIDYIKEKLHKIEVIDISGGCFIGNFYTDFLIFCPNLRRLRINQFRIVCKSMHENDWLQQKYPKLKKFELTGDKNIKTSELMVFFRENRNIRSFTTDGKHFSEPDFLNLIVNYKLKLDELTIVKEYTIDELKRYVCGQLNLLHQYGFYKQIHFLGVTNSFSQEAINQISTIRGLRTLRCGYPLSPMPKVNWSPLIGLRKLNTFYYPQSEIQMQEFARSLVNLEEISLLQATFDDILPLIFYSMKLRIIKVQHVMDEFFNVSELKKIEFFNGSTLNLAALDRERKKLYGAKKVIIYVSEHVYLTMKWAIGQTNFDLIEIKRDFS